MRNLDSLSLEENQNSEIPEASISVFSSGDLGYITHNSCASNNTTNNYLPGNNTSRSYYFDKGCRDRNRLLIFSSFLFVSILIISLGISTFFYPLAAKEADGSTSSASDKSTETRSARLQRLFARWPNQKPDLVLMLTGQMEAYIQKCGCSSPQKGGLDRRYNFLEWLKKDKGLEVLSLDLGDLSDPEKTKLNAQAKLKYRYSMKALQAMDYFAIGVGPNETRLPLSFALAEFTIQDEKAYPKVHFANILDNEKIYVGTDKPWLYDNDVYPGKNKINVGVVGIVGTEAKKQISEIDREMKFADQSGEVLKNSLKKITQKLKKEADVNVLLYEGSLEDAKKVAALFPQFSIILCRSNEAEPPHEPTKVEGTDTLILQVGKRGQNVGIVGIFRTIKQGKPALDFVYSVVAMTDDFETPEDKVVTQPVHKLLQQYADEVAANNYLKDFPKIPHQVQAQFANIKTEGGLVHFVGSDACKKCHFVEYNTWSNTKHAHAFEDLKNKAKNPSKRHLDGECIVCHSVGFEYQSGYDGSENTKHLINVGCENCHGPGSLHSDQPNNKRFYSALSPWKRDGKGELPSLEILKKLEKNPTAQDRDKLLTSSQETLMRNVGNICQKCHDVDNDPHYKFEVYWPKIVHGKGKR